MSDQYPPPSDQSPEEPPGEDAPPESPPQQPPVYGQSPYGQPAYGQDPYGQPAYGQSPYGQYPYAGSPYGAPGRAPDARPGTVTAAAIVTWVLSGMSALFFGAAMFVLVVARDEAIAEIERQPGVGEMLRESGLSVDSVVGMVIAVCGLFLVWALVAMVLALFAFRGSNGARIGLVISAGVVALLSLISITSGVSIMTLGGAIAVIVLLFVGDAGAWYASKRPQY